MNCNTLITWWLWWNVLQWQIFVVHVCLRWVWVVLEMSAGVLSPLVLFYIGRIREGKAEVIHTWVNNYQLYKPDHSWSLGIIQSSDLKGKSPSLSLSTHHYSHSICGSDTPMSTGILANVWFFFFHLTFIAFKRVFLVIYIMEKLSLIFHTGNKKKMSAFGMKQLLFIQEQPVL